jgi:tetratricopeptide (TPR) repeat protein
MADKESTVAKVIRGECPSVERAIKQFQDAWANGAKPKIDDLLPADEPDRSASLRALVQLELRWRLEAGEPARIEEYLQRYPQIASPDTVLALIETEYRQRRAAEPALVLADYLDRFPQHRSDLLARLGDPIVTATFNANATRTANRDEMDTLLPGGLHGATQSATEPAIDGFLSERERPLLPGYELLRVLGRGGMGVVYMARQTGLNRLVGLKMVLSGAHASSEQLSRFRAEAKSVARLQHPNIVQIYEVGEHNGLPYFSMEFVDGGSLAQKLQSTRLRTYQAAELVQTLARAMHYAHQRDIIHRDLKPHNVLIAVDGTPKITDFGLAKQLDEDTSQTRTGAVLGTPGYMAPEQAYGRTKSIGPASDIYGLGAILYEVLTGVPPFQRPTLLDTLNAVRSQEPVPPSRLQPKLPRDLEVICLKCLQKEPRKRYGSALELAEDLHLFLAGEPIHARAVSPVERLARWVRRNPRIAFLLSLVFASMSLAIIVLLISMRRIEAQKARAEQAQAEEQAARSRETEARRIADLKRKEADENAAKALYLTGVSQNILLGVVTTMQQKLQERPGTQKLREDLLNQATAGLDQVASLAGNSPLASRVRGGVYQRKGDMFRDMGKTKEALEQFQLCRTAFSDMDRTLSPDNPDREIARFNLAVADMKLGEIVYRLGDVAGARRYFHDAAETRQQLADANLKNPELRSRRGMLLEALATSYTWLGELSAAEGDLSAARDAYGQALAVRQSLTPRPKDSAGLRGLALSYQTLGKLSSQLDDRQATERYYADLIGIYEKLVSSDADNVAYKRDLATSFESRGDAYCFWRRPDAALADYHRSHKLRKQMLAAEPDFAAHQGDLAASYYRLGTAYLLAGQTAEADQSYAECLHLREKQAAADPANREGLLGLMLARARSGDHVAAAKLADRVYQTAAGNSAYLFQAACGYALCASAVGGARQPADKAGAEAGSAADAYAQKAIQILREAIDKGYKDRVSLRCDPDLMPLQDRPDFVELLTHLKSVPGHG